MVNFKSKAFWYAVAAFLIAPVILNFTIFGFRSHWTNGSGDQWFSFWGNYIGGILSALVAYIIAHSQIQKQLKLDLAKEKYNKTINQLPALVRLKLELDKFIRELTRVKQERESFIERNGGIMKKPDEHENVEDFFDDTTGIEESKVTEKYYNIELADPDIFKLLEQVENVDLHVDLIKAFSFYNEFSQALLFNHEIAYQREREIYRSIMGRDRVPTEINEQLVSLSEQSSNVYAKKKNGWNSLYEEFTLERLKEILNRLESEIQIVKDMKENGDPTINGN